MESTIYPQLKDKTAIVTGASSGIGQGIAKAFGQAGMKVLVNYHSDEEGANATANEIRKHHGEAIILQADVGKEKDVRRMFEVCRENFGPLDIMVSNAGIQKDAAFHEMSLEDWEKVINTNLTGQFLCCREATKTFLHEKEKRRNRKSIGNIICISSVHDIIPWAGHANYVAAKGGVMMLMKSIAQELAEHRIRVNSISPGAIKTSINDSSWKDEEKRRSVEEDMIPYKRFGEPEDIAKAALWLASDDSDYVTGATLYVDGGMTLYPSFRSGG